MSDTHLNRNLELHEISGQSDLQIQAEGDDATAHTTQLPVEQSLPPADGGKVAWRFLCIAFVFESLLWGFPLSFGVFQNYYSRLPEFEHSPFISVIGTIASGMSYMAAPVMIILIKRFQRYRKMMIWIGWPICIISLVAGSFTRSLGGLIVTQGVLYGVGFMIFYYPILDMLGEFWVVRRGMAAGIMCSASGFSGIVFPFAIEAALNKYGYPTTLRGIAIGLSVLTGPLIPLLDGRLPVSHTSAVGKTDWSFLKAPLFWIYSASNLMMGFGYFFPALYIPSYATANGLTSLQGAILLALISISQVFGQMSFGYLSDRKVSINALAASSALVASIAVYTCWGLAHNFRLLVVFCLIYGYFGAGYTALWVRMGSTVSSDRTGAFAAFGLLNVGKGIGNVSAGPISGVLLRKTIDVHAYGSARYESVVLFSATCLALSAAIIPFGYIGKPARVNT